MKNNMDTETLIAIKREERGEQDEIKEEENRIMRMPVGKEKQSAWTAHFTKMVRSDDYLNGLIF